MLLVKRKHLCLSALRVSDEVLMPEQRSPTTEDSDYAKQASVDHGAQGVTRNNVGFDSFLRAINSFRYEITEPTGLLDHPDRKI